MGYLTNGLTFNTLRNGNLQRVSHFRDSQGRLCHPNGIEDWSVAEWLQAMVGEVGEFANLHKKVQRGDITIDDAKQELADELADIQTYLDLLAARLGIDLGRATMEKWNAVSRRVGVPISISAEDYHWHRDPEDKKGPQPDGEQS